MVYHAKPALLCTFPVHHYPEHSILAVIRIDLLPGKSHLMYTVLLPILVSHSWKQISISNAARVSDLYIDIISPIPITQYI